MECSSVTKRPSNTMCDIGRRQLSNTIKAQRCNNPPTIDMESELSGNQDIIYGLSTSFLSPVDCCGGIKVKKRRQSDTSDHEMKTEGQWGQCIMRLAEELHHHLPSPCTSHCIIHDECNTFTLTIINMADNKFLIYCTTVLPCICITQLKVRCNTRLIMGSFNDPSSAFNIRQC
eukprot:scaffold2588_cov45-Cyclotella_meneghiniana.AAC.3